MENFQNNQIFNDFEEFAATTRSWDVDFRQIEKGRFKADLSQYVSKNFQLARASFNRGLDQKGSSPEGLWSFAIAAYSSIPLIFKGKETGPNDIMLYPPGSEICAISKPGFDILTFSASENYLESISEKNGLPEFGKQFKGIDIVTCKKERITNVRHILSRLFSEMQEKDFQIENCHGKFDKIENLSKDILYAIYSCKKSYKAHNQIKLREAAFHQAAACIEAHAGDPMTVRGLVRSTGVSERTLEYVFREHLGLSPKAYIRTYRLNRARRDLIKSSQSAVKIADIANRWGFWHMGQFAKDYRKFFGELPSETIGKKKL